jgi:hypothetical protein
MRGQHSPVVQVPSPPRRRALYRRHACVEAIFRPPASNAARKSAHQPRTAQRRLSKNVPIAAATPADMMIRPGDKGSSNRSLCDPVMRQDIARAPSHTHRISVTPFGVPMISSMSHSPARFALISFVMFCGCPDVMFQKNSCDGPVPSTTQPTNSGRAVVDAAGACERGHTRSAKATVSSKWRCHGGGAHTQSHKIRRIWQQKATTTSSTRQP